MKPQASSGLLCLSIERLAAAGRWNEARPSAERLSQELLSKGVGPYWLGLIELQAGNAISAFRQLDKALERNPSVLWVHLNLGLCYAILRQYTLFEREMQWIIERYPDQPLAYYYLGRHLSKNKEDIDHGLVLLRKAVSLNPSDFRARYHLGYLFELKNHYQEAKAEYEKAVDGVAASGSSYSWPLQGLARLYLQQANLGEALTYAQRAVKAEPKLTDSQLLLSKIYLQSGELGQAITSLERAVALDPTDPSPHYLLSRVYSRMKRPADAARVLSRYSELKAAYGD